MARARKKLTRSGAVALFPGAAQWGASEDPLGWAFLEHLKVQGASPATQVAYRRVIGELRQQMGESFSGWEHAGNKECVDYISKLQKGKRSERYICVSVAAVRSFFRWMQKPNPLPTVRRRRTRSLPSVVGVSDIERMVESTGRSSKQAPRWAAARDSALLETIYSAGLRLAEVIGVNVGDLNLKEGTLKVLGKGSKERITFLGEPAVEALNCYMREAGVAGPANAPLFISKRRLRISRRAVADIVARAGRRAGLGPITPHSLRHSMATHMLDEGAGIREIQRILGHASMATTQIYTQVSVAKARAAYKAAHPRA